MTRMILRRVLPFAKGHVRRTLYDTRTTCLRMQVAVDVRHGDVNVL